MAQIQADDFQILLGVEADLALTRFSGEIGFYPESQTAARLLIRMAARNMPWPVFR